MKLAKFLCNFAVCFLVIIIHIRNFMRYFHNSFNLSSTSWKNPKVKVVRVVVISYIYNFYESSLPSMSSKQLLAQSQLEKLISKCISCLKWMIRATEQSQRCKSRFSIINTHLLVTKEKHFCSA